jgi:hypothetical protein
LPHPAGAGEAVRAEAGGDEEAAHLGLAEDELVVGRERLGPVDQPHDLHLLERRDAARAFSSDLLEAVPVLLEQLAVEVGRDAEAVERPRRGVALVAAHHEAAALLAEVDEDVGVAHRRQVERQLAKRLRDEVLVRHRDDRHATPASRRSPREHAAGVDDDLGLDRRPCRSRRRDAAALDVDRRSRACA